MKEYNFKINGNDYNVAVKIQSDNEAEVLVNGASYTVEVVDATVKKAVAVKPQVAAVPRFASRAAFDGAGFQTRPGSGRKCGRKPVKSRCPGVILDIRIKEGDTVSVGQTLMVLEAMKMENNIDSDRAGVVKSVKVNRGDSVLEGDVLITLG